MPKIKFLGGVREVGRSSILIESKTGAKCILDHGIRFKGKERLPQEPDTTNLKAIALTHCHVDHSGALPYLYKNATPPFFTNPVSLKISEVLIKDSLRISNFSYPFGHLELQKLIQNSYFLKNGKRQKIDDNFYLTFINAGHIPGSVSILVEVDNKRILYSGDINTQQTNLNKSANSSDIPEIDGLIVESTYALREHPPREELEEKFVDRVINTIENGGRVLVPAFGVARSQEVLMILNKYNYKGKIFMAGLAKEVSKIYLDHPESIKNIRMLKKALKKTQFVSTKSVRTNVKKYNGVIIAPSGMLKGGVAMAFIKSFLNDPLSAIYLVGYQVEGSPGKMLLDKGIFKYNENSRKKHAHNAIEIHAKCERDYFDFSSHADSVHLREYIENLNFYDNSKNIFCVHGDPKSTTSLSSTFSSKGYNSVAPEIGEVYTI